MRFATRIFYHFSKNLIKILDGRLSRHYMRLYLKLLSIMGVKFTGAPRYISSSVRFDDFDRITLGERVVISEKVIFLTHDYSITTGLIALNEIPKSDIAIIRDIKIGNNVFIGMSAIIMPGCAIGDNVVIGAGSVVRGTVDSDTILIGNPATVVGKLTDKAMKWKSILSKVDHRQD